MRSRLLVPASLLAATTTALCPALALAAPQRSHHITINVTPNPITSGDEVLIYGQVNLPKPGHRLVVLWHRVNPNPRFTVVQTTSTDALGFYEFNRAEGVVTTNRNWYTTSPGPGDVHSRTVHERVFAELTLSADRGSARTGHPVTFTGRISPGDVHAGERVVLQRHDGEGDEAWARVASGRIGPDGSYSIPFRFAQPGEKELRVAFRGDPRNIASVSSSVQVSVQQAENPRFTITSSAPTIDVGQSAVLSGILQDRSSDSPRPGVSVTLWAHAHGVKFAPIASATTGPDGGYSFTVSPQHNTAYQVRTTFATPTRQVTSILYEGVRAVVTIAGSATTSQLGGTVTFSGNVTPEKAGHVILLERRGADGDFHVVAKGRVDASSAYRFDWRFGSSGTKTFRAELPGGPSNVGADSTPVTVTVSPIDVRGLPPAHSSGDTSLGSAT